MAGPGEGFGGWLRTPIGYIIVGLVVAGTLSAVLKYTANKLDETYFPTNTTVIQSARAAAEDAPVRTYNKPPDLSRPTILLHSGTRPATQAAATAKAGVPPASGPATRP